MNMVEKVARAICGRAWLTTARTPAEVDRDWRNYEVDARAAIEAMREPTEVMVEAAVTNGLDDLPHRPTVGDRVKGEYQAMITAALND